MHPTKPPIYRSREQIEQLVQAFESCALPPDQFNHHAHMTVALWYLAHMPWAEATDRMRSSLRRFALFHGHGQRYHETLTMFWMRLLHHYLGVIDPNDSLPETIYHALRSLGRMELVFHHYSKECVFSEQARAQWVAPDRVPLPFGETGA